MAVEPNVKTISKYFEKVELKDFDEAKEIADIHVLLVDHKEFRDKHINSKYIIDTKGIW
jgi:UDP-N-acetyl-D-mannosaminuronic acid dehydrogenase